MSAIEVKVPDIGDFKNVPVIEINVKPGDIVKADDPLIVLESDKASMEVPAPQGGKVIEIKLKVGDKVAEGALILTLVVNSLNLMGVSSMVHPLVTGAVILIAVFFDIVMRKWSD